MRNLTNVTVVLSLAVGFVLTAQTAAAKTIGPYYSLYPPPMSGCKVIGPDPNPKAAKAGWKTWTCEDTSHIVGTFGPSVTTCDKHGNCSVTASVGCIPPNCASTNANATKSVQPTNETNEVQQRSITGVQPTNESWRYNAGYLQGVQGTGLKGHHTVEFLQGYVLVVLPGSSSSASALEGGGDNGSGDDDSGG